MVRASVKPSPPGHIGLFGFNLLPYVVEECTYALGMKDIPHPIRPGETVPASFEWDTTCRVGDVTIEANIRPGTPRGYDHDRTNYVATHDTYARVGGLGGFL